MSAKINTIIGNIDNKFDAQFNFNPEVHNNSHPEKHPPIVQDTNHEYHQIRHGQLRDQQFEGQIKLLEKQHNKTPSPLKNFAVKQKISQKKVHFQDENGQKNNEEEKNDRGYQSLANTLQTALKKMNTSKKQVNKLNKNKTMNLLTRFNEHEKKKQKQIDQKRAIEEQKKYLGMKQKPDINAKSRKIAEQSSYKPIYERFQRILEEKKKKRQQNEEEKKAKEEEQYGKFLVEYQSHVKLHSQDCRDSETFFHDMVSWKSKLEKQRQEKHKIKQEKQKQGLTFKPELNKKSMKMAQKAKRVPVQDRETTRLYNQEGYALQAKKRKKEI